MQQMQEQFIVPAVETSSRDTRPRLLRGKQNNLVKYENCKYKCVCILTDIKKAGYNLIAKV